MEERFERTGCILHVHVGGEVIRTTPEHPFFVQGEGWKQAGALAGGDRIATLSGEWVSVEEVFDTQEWEPVYNLRVADHHTYFVGDEHWGWAAWAHNAYMPGADQTFASLGVQYTNRAVSLMTDNFPPSEHSKMTIAVSSVAGREVVVLYANAWNSTKPVPPGIKLVPRALIDAFKSAVDQSGADFRWADSSAHAEIVLRGNYPSIQAMGLSNPGGPCTQCKEYFMRGGWKNIWYPPV